MTEPTTTCDFCGKGIYQETEMIVRFGDDHFVCEPCGDVFMANGWNPTQISKEPYPGRPLPKEVVAEWRMRNGWVIHFFESDCGDVVGTPNQTQADYIECDTPAIVERKETP